MAELAEAADLKGPWGFESPLSAPLEILRLCCAPLRISVAGSRSVHACLAEDRDYAECLSIQPADYSQPGQFVSVHEKNFSPPQIKKNWKVNLNYH
jgi:hypothetical protein